MFLSDVTKPILEDHNYSTFIGKPIRLKALEGKAINYDQPYVFVRGAIIQDLIRIDYTGKPIFEIVDRALWNAADATNKPYLFESFNDTTKMYETHDVWHESCKYRCIASHTSQEPRWNASDWVHLSGDTKLSMKLFSSQGEDFEGPIDTIITVKVYHGLNDITSDVFDSDIEWTRTTRDTNDDNAWASLQADAGKIIHITDKDVGAFFEIDGICSFTCKVFVRDGDITSVTEQTFNI